MINSTPPRVVATNLYNANEASALLGVHRNTLRQYVSKKRLHPKVDMFTGRYLYEGKELERFWYSRIH